MTIPLRLGLVGLGKIARDQHLPAIAQTAGVELIAVASRNATADGVENFPDLEAMLARKPELDAIILCQPPKARYEAAARALAAGKHVFLEKPPGSTVSEVEALVTLARTKGVTLFASWHSRYASGVAEARRLIAERTVRSIAINWLEDVRYWHPGQPWIWQAGGFGVFDPGINALSILTEIVPHPIIMLEAMLAVPSNCDAPVAAKLNLRTAPGVPIEAIFDFRQTGPQIWDIAIDTDQGNLLLSEGGNCLSIGGVPQMHRAEEEYPAMYRHFVELTRSGKCDVNLDPLRLVADAFLCGRHYPTEAFWE